MTNLQRFFAIDSLEKHITKSALAGNYNTLGRLKAEWERLVKEGDITYKPK